ncbi:transcriptional antiterminator, BglG family [Pelagirhabdus alkalitolerans]|uniref:Transcriptional antiterminator, BglG family n=1 Tax=Pelagirhabdus alkalitolerans TaxID=1612202 RepID=A0A1G6JZ43_9BACI|nr:BglG family transcription antiterminator [Pelagirhabdus alkalitolerans]SDC23963.1 transcriptional antiterminator, BglG family [Pelagirhabdus alkalitolerans]
MYISGRERKIIEELLNNRSGMTIEELASILDVSSRTIHRDLKIVKDIVAEHRLTLNKKAGVGVKLEGSLDNKKALALSLDQVEYTDYTPEERHAIILTTLLETSEPIKLFTLANELNVTVATVSHDLDKIEESLKEYKLVLIRKRGYGVEVEGKESNKRAALSHLISKYVDELDFMLFIKKNLDTSTKSPLDSISDRLLGLVDQSKLKTIEKSIDYIKQDLPYELADRSYIGLVVHLALAIERIQKGERIHFDLDYLKELTGTKEYMIAEKIITELQNEFQLSIPVDEIGYITMHLLGAKLRSDQDYLLEDSSINIIHYTKALIIEVEKRIGIPLTNQKNLFHDLVSHLKPTIYRIQTDMHINNPLTEEIKRDYKELFQTIRDACAIVFDNITFPEEEIAYLVLHFASASIPKKSQPKLSALVICSSGIGTSKMLGSRINQEITEIDQIDHCSLFELDSIESNNYDLIVSTIPLKEQIQDYELVSPILTENEIMKLKSIIKSKTFIAQSGPSDKDDGETLTELDIQKRLERMQNYSRVTLELLLSFEIYKVEENCSKEEIIKLACDRLADSQYIIDVPEVYQALLKREKLGGLGIPGTKLTLFHARQEQIKKPTFVIYHLSNPISVKGMDDNHMITDTLLLMLSPLEAESECLEVLSFISGLIISEQETIALFESSNKDNIKQYLSKKLNEFINEKL